MFKNTLALLFIFFVLVAPIRVNANSLLIAPIEDNLENGGSLELGNIAAGETLELIIQKKSGLGFDWSRIIVDEAALPAGWAAISIATDKTLVAQISLPADASQSIQRIPFSLESDAMPFSNENFSAYISVKENLMNVSIDGLKQEAMVEGQTFFRLVANNESIAEHALHITSTLPEYWFEPLDLVVGPKQTLDFNLMVVPKNYGPRAFFFTVNSSMNDFSQSFAAELNVYSTLRGKFTSSILGMPFFTLSLFPQLILNGFLALLS